MNGRLNKNKKLTSLALTIAFAMILSYVESKVPPLVAIPGIKVGFANIAVIFTLYKFSAKDAAIVSLLRVLLVSMLFGTGVSLIYSLSGAILSLTVMILLKKLTPLREVTVSVCGGVMHNVGQIAAASFMLSTNVVVYYLPFLVLSGTIAGIAVGLTAAVMVKKIDLNKI